MKVRRRQGGKKPPTIQTVEMTDGRVYSSQDGWKTVFLVTPAGKKLVEDQEEAAVARDVFSHSSE